MKKDDLAEKRDLFGNTTIGSAAKYALLPGIFPRLRSLAGALNHFLFTFVQIFGIVGLIDKAHPCLRPENIGRYRFGEIISLASENVVFDRKHLMQTIMFFAVLGTIFLCAAMLFVSIALVVLKVPEAQAQYFGLSSDGGYEKQNDWVFKFLQEVFGKTGMTSLWGGTGNNPDQHFLLHPILRQMFQTYSQALLVIAAFMVIYLIVSMLLDSARTGQPFGRNFNSVWAPIRLALGIGLLVPVSSTGYNGAQLVAFQMADWGSNLATNVWISGLNAFATSGKDPGKKLIGMMQPVEPYKFMRGVFLARVCEAAVNKLADNGLDDDTVAEVRQITDNNGHYINYEGAVKESYGPLFITLNADYCGQFKIPEQIDTTHFSDIGKAKGGSINLGVLPQKVIESYQSSTISMIDDIFTDAARIIVDNKMGNDDLKISELAKQNPELGTMHADALYAYRSALGYKADASGRGMYLQNDPYPALANTDGESLVTLLATGKKYGWASAGSFMMTLVYANNVMSSAVNTPPIVVSMPRALNKITASPYGRNATVSEGSLWEHWFGSDEVEAVSKINKVLNDANTWFVDWPRDEPAQFLNDGTKITGIDYGEWRAQLSDGSSQTPEGMSPMEDGIHNFVLSMISVDQQDMNPLAGVIAIGNALFILAAYLVYVGLGLAYPTAGASLTFSLSVAIPLTMGAYMLVVVLPSALFFNFLFAVIEWVISIFEAVLGMPLWALSFISVSGDGIGQTAQGGFMKLVEIMLRPTVIVTATVGSFILFSASAHFFNNAYAMYIDTYFSTVTGPGASLLMFVGSMFLYTMALYSIGNSCFKMIPAIANQFMQWIGGPQGFSHRMDANMDHLSGMGVMASATGFALAAGQTASQFFKPGPLPTTPSGGGGGGGKGSGSGKPSGATANPPSYTIPTRGGNTTVAGGGNTTWNATTTAAPTTGGGGAPAAPAGGAAPTPGNQPAAPPATSSMGNINATYSITPTKKP